MKDMNIAKLTSVDLPLFNGIMSDLFPGVETPVIDYGKVSKARIERHFKFVISVVLSGNEEISIWKCDEKHAKYSGQILTRFGESTKEFLKSYVTVPDFYLCTNYNITYHIITITSSSSYGRHHYHHHISYPILCYLSYFSVKNCHHEGVKGTWLTECATYRVQGHPVIRDEELASLNHDRRCYPVREDGLMAHSAECLVIVKQGWRIALSTS